MRQNKILVLLTTILAAGAEIVPRNCSGITVEIDTSGLGKDKASCNVLCNADLKKQPCEQLAWCTFQNNTCVYRDFENDLQHLLDDASSHNASPFHLKSIETMFQHSYCSRNERKYEQCDPRHYNLFPNYVSVKDEGQFHCTYFLKSENGFSSYGCHGTNGYCNFFKGKKKTDYKNQCDKYPYCEWNEDIATDEWYASDESFKKFNPACGPKSLHITTINNGEDCSSLPLSSPCNTAQYCGDKNHFDVDKLFPPIDYSNPNADQCTVYFDPSYDLGMKFEHLNNHNNVIGRFDSFDVVDPFYYIASGCFDDSDRFFGDDADLGTFQSQNDELAVKMPHFGNDQLALSYVQYPANQNGVFVGVSRTFYANDPTEQCTNQNMYNGKEGTVKSFMLTKECPLFQYDTNCQNSVFHVKNLAITTTGTMTRLGSIKLGEIKTKNQLGEENSPGKFVQIEIPKLYLENRNQMNVSFDIKGYDMNYFYGSQFVSKDDEFEYYSRVKRGALPDIESGIARSDWYIQGSLQYSQNEFQNQITRDASCDTVDNANGVLSYTSHPTVNGHSRIEIIIPIADSVKFTEFDITINPATPFMKSKTSNQFDFAFIRKNGELQVHTDPSPVRIKGFVTKQNSGIAGENCGSMNYTGSVKIVYDTLKEEVNVASNIPRTLNVFEDFTWGLETDIDVIFLNKQVKHGRRLNDSKKIASARMRNGDCKSGKGVSDSKRWFKCNGVPFPLPETQKKCDSSNKCFWRRGKHLTGQLYIFPRICYKGFTGPVSVYPDKNACILQKLGKRARQLTELDEGDQGSCNELNNEIVIDPRLTKVVGETEKLLGNIPSVDPNMELDFTLKCNTKVKSFMILDHLTFENSILQHSCEEYPQSCVEFEPYFEHGNFIGSKVSFPSHIGYCPIEDESSRSFTVSLKHVRDCSAPSVNNETEFTYSVYDNSEASVHGLPKNPTMSLERSYDEIRTNATLTLMSKTLYARMWLSKQHLNELDTETIQVEFVNQPVSNYGANEVQVSAIWSSNQVCTTTTIPPFKSKVTSTASYSFSGPNTNNSTFTLEFTNSCERIELCHDKHGQLVSGPICVNVDLYPTSPPTTIPTNEPTKTPTIPPTRYPTISPTNAPSIDPTSSPTESPTTSPTLPTESPTLSPVSPTVDPTQSPTISPTPPTDSPTISPTIPTELPTNSPSRSPTVQPTTYPTDICDVDCPTGLQLFRTFDYITGTVFNADTVFSSTSGLCSICSNWPSECLEPSYEVTNATMTYMPSIKYLPLDRRYSARCSSESECRSLCLSEETCWAFQMSETVDGTFLGYIHQTLTTDVDTENPLGDIWVTYAKTLICKPTDIPLQNTKECLIGYASNELALPTQEYKQHQFALLTETKCNDFSDASDNTNLFEPNYRWESVVKLDPDIDMTASKFSLPGFYVAKSFEQLVLQDDTLIERKFPKHFLQYYIEKAFVPKSMIDERPYYAECSRKYDSREGEVFETISVDDYFKFSGTRCEEPPAVPVRLMFRHNLVDGKIETADELQRCIGSDGVTLYTDTCYLDFDVASVQLWKIRQCTGVNLIQIEHSVSGKCMALKHKKVDDSYTVQLDHLFFKSEKVHIKEQEITLKDCALDSACTEKIDTSWETIPEGKFRNTKSNMCLGEYDTGQVRGVVKLSQCELDLMYDNDKLPIDGCFGINQLKKKSIRKAECAKYKSCKWLALSGICQKRNLFLTTHRIEGEPARGCGIFDEEENSSDAAWKARRTKCFQYTHCAWVPCKNCLAQCVPERELFGENVVCKNYNSSGQCNRHYKCEWTRKKCTYTHKRRACENKKTKRHCNKIIKCNWDDSTNECKWKTPDYRGKHNGFDYRKMFGKYGQLIIPIKQMLPDLELNSFI